MQIRPILRMPGYLTIGLFVATLVVFNGGSWVFLQLVRESKERDLGQRLLAIGTTASVIIGNENLTLPEATVIENYTGLPTYQYLLTLLRAIRVKNDLLNIIVLDSQGHVLADARRRLPLGKKHPLIEIDEVELKQAQAGKSATTPYYNLKEMPHKRAYVPVIAPDGTLLYILRLEASRDYFFELDLLKRYVYWIDGIGSLLLGFIALIFHRLVRRVIRAEETVSRTERLQALGTMAATLAHEIRNPLGIIRASAEEMKTELMKNHTEHSISLLDDIIAECDRINHEITLFLQWGPGGRTTQKGYTQGGEIPVISLLDSIKDLKKIIVNIAERRGIKAEFELPEEELRAKIEPLALRQALLNLVMNAIEASQKGGAVRIRVKRNHKKPGFANIEIIDYGVGMTRRELRRALEPFFTTKPRGTGLGLTIASRTIEMAGGKIDISSQPGKGTRVTISLPVHSE